MFGPGNAAPLPGITKAPIIYIMSSNVESTPAARSSRPSPGANGDGRLVAPPYGSSNHAAKRESNGTTPERALKQGQAQAESHGGADQGADPQRFVHYLSGFKAVTAIPADTTASPESGPWKFGNRVQLIGGHRILLFKKLPPAPEPFPGSPKRSTPPVFPPGSRPASTPRQLS